MGSLVPTMISLALILTTRIFTLGPPLMMSMMRSLQTLVSMTSWWLRGRSPGVRATCHELKFYSPRLSNFVQRFATLRIPKINIIYVIKGIQEILKLIYLRLAISIAVTILCHWTHMSTMINMMTTLLTVHPVPPHVQRAEKAQLSFVSHSLLIHDLLQLLLKEAFPICLLRCLHHLKKIHPQALGL